MIVKIQVLNVDLDKLRRSIYEYNYCNPSMSPKYLIMSNDTLILIKSNSVVKMEYDSTNQHTLFGIEIAICNSLELGEIDII